MGNERRVENSCPPYLRPRTALRLQTGSRVFRGSTQPDKSSGRPGRGRQAHKGKPRRHFPVEALTGRRREPKPNPSSQRRGNPVPTTKAGEGVARPRKPEPGGRLPGPGAPRPGSARASASGWKLQAASGQAARGRVQCHPHPRLAQLPRSNAIHRDALRPRWPGSPGPPPEWPAEMGVQGPHPGIFGCIFHALPPRPQQDPGLRASAGGPRYPVVSAPSPQPLGTSNKRTFLQTFLSGHFAGFLSLAPSSQNLHSIQ